MTLTERIAVLQRVADALAAVRAALLPLPDADRRAVLAGVLAELERPAVNEPPPVVQPPPPGKPVPRPTREPTQRLALALSGGPLRVQEVAERAGCSEAAASQGLRNNIDLFEKLEPANRMSPWRLTEAGRNLAAALTTAPAT